MTKASDKELSVLHKQVASAFSQALQAKEEAQQLLDEHGSELPDAVKWFLEKYAVPNPSLLAAATKFLKDNNITCVIEDSAELSNTARLLQEKRRVTDMPVEDTQH